MSTTTKRFSYQGDPSATPVDAVRFLIGDTNPDRVLLDDREIAHAITQNPNHLLAAATLAEHLFGRFAGQADVSVGPVSRSFGNIATRFKEKATQLRNEAIKYSAPSFPATQHSTKEVLTANGDLPNPDFRVGMSDNPFAVQLNDDLDVVGFNGFIIG